MKIQSKSIDKSSVLTKNYIQTKAHHPLENCKMRIKEFVGHLHMRNPWSLVRVATVNICEPPFVAEKHFFYDSTHIHGLDSWLVQGSLEPTASDR